MQVVDPDSASIAVVPGTPRCLRVGLFSIRSHENLAELSKRAEPAAPSFIATVHGVSLLAGRQADASDGETNEGSSEEVEDTAAARVVEGRGSLGAHCFRLQVSCGEDNLVRAELLPDSTACIGATFRVKLGLTAGEERGLQVGSSLHKTPLVGL